jgi:hypothetical protein
MKRGNDEIRGEVDYTGNERGRHATASKRFSSEWLWSELSTQRHGDTETQPGAI